MKNKLVLIGGGGHCKSVLDSLLRSGIYDEIVITDQEIPADTNIMGCRIAGNDGALPNLLTSGFTDAFITVGSVKNTTLRRRLYELACSVGLNIVNIIDDSAVVSEHCRLGKGIFIGKNAVINAEAQIGNAAIINSGAIIEHECVVGDFTHISVGAKLCGNVTVGKDSLIGAGSAVIQGIKIGDRSIIGAGSVVIKDVPSDTMRTGLIKS